MPSFTAHWAQEKARIAELRANGDVIITVKGRRIQVICPKDNRFIDQANALGGTFRFRTETWTFNIRALSMLRAVCEGIWPEKVTVSYPTKTSR